MLLGSECRGGWFFFFFVIIFLNVSLFNAGSRAGCSRFPGLFTLSIINDGMFLSSWWQCMY